jgi:hypothetical protein
MSEKTENNETNIVGFVKKPTVGKIPLPEKGKK